MFLFRLGARRRLRFDLGSAAGIENLNRIAQTSLENVPHSDTLAYFLKRFPVGAMSRLRRDMVRGLLRSRAFERFRLLGRYYLVAIDATGHLSFKKRHCPHCLTQEREGGQTVYYHLVLEAKLVCENGFAISIATEFIENTDGASKQDCELSAFYRLVGRLRRDYPMLQTCLLLDSLYLNQNVMRLCRENRFRYIITFKEGSLPVAYGEFQALHRLQPENILEVEEPKLSRRYRWLNGLEHEGNKFNAFECVETDDKGNQTTFLWAGDIEVHRGNVRILSDRGGRRRWKIENEGFNTQKNQGYELEHAYCEKMNAAKNFYILLQIAHMLSQLLEKGNLLGGPVKKLFGSLRAFARRLFEAFRYFTIGADMLEKILSARFQIRFDHC